jgi:hypothetical protein
LLIQANLRKSHPVYGHPDCVLCLDLCTRAIERLKQTGFERVCVSAKSEAVYFRISERHGVLRVATHRNGSQEHIGLQPIVSWITFRGGRGHRDAMLMTDDRFEGILAIAIGQYWLRSSEPREQRYKGKRGTWENAAAPVFLSGYFTDCYEAGERPDGFIGPESPGSS